MTESISFKVYLKRDGQEVEVRRFGIEGGAATNYMYLRGKIQAMFPTIQNDQFKVFWQDNDKDYITIDSDEELVEALTGTNQPLRLYVQVKQQQYQGGCNNSQQVHPGVVCDGCEGDVVGNRYKCVTCADYDLCTKCESAGHHPEHFMLRMPTPVNAFCRPKVFRKFFAKPHKFHKRHGWSRMAEKMCGEAYGPAASHCPFSKREDPVAATASVTDMFDFSALLDLLNSLGVTIAGERGTNEATVSGEGTSSSQTQQNQTRSSQQPSQNFKTQSQAESRTNTAEYLTNIGQAISTFLDPFGVDVTFDVRAPQRGTQEAATPSTPQQDIPTIPANNVPTPDTPADTQAPPAIEVPTTESSAAGSQTMATAAIATVRESSSATGRRNSDDWTLLNRESPTRSDEVAMDVDESRGAKPKVSTTYPELPKDTPSAPPQADSGMQDSERQKIQEAVDRIRSMGFNLETTLLRELLQRENGDIASVLEMIFNNRKI